MFVVISLFVVVGDATTSELSIIDTLFVVVGVCCVDGREGW